MEFKDELRKYTERLENIKDTLQTEEATKMSLIVPFFQLLGYDVFNPLEFCPEYTADIGIKKGEKVDYAILENDEPIILVECKWCGETLDKHRRLMPRECLRLQGFDEWQIDRILAIQSDAQAYKQAVNSVTANVIEAIGRRIREVDAELKVGAAA